MALINYQWKSLTSNVNYMLS